MTTNLALANNSNANSNLSSPLSDGALAGGVGGALDSTPEPRRVAWLIGMGVFTTFLATPLRLGKIPLQTLLKDDLKVTPEAMATFFAVASIAIYLRPLAGLLADSVPILGSRRRYLIASGLAGAALWALTAKAESYGALLAASVGVTAAAVLGSATVGGLLVDQAHTKGAAGKLSSLRMTVTNIGILVGGPLGGYLAMRACGVGAILMLGLSFAAFALMKEGARARGGAEKPALAWRSIVSVSRSAAVRSAAIISFVFYLAPGFQSLLFFHQRDALGLTPQRIGLLAAINGVFGVAAALWYGRLCRRATMRSLLVLGILLYALSSCFYLAYRSYPAAIAVEAANGFVGMLGLMPFHDLAARSAPRGGAALGFALILGIAYLGISLSEVIGTQLAAAFNLSVMDVVAVSVIATVASLASLVLLPRSIGDLKEGQQIRP
jgi:predicted MFS family arabinose efflux permease